MDKRNNKIAAYNSDDIAIVVSKMTESVVA